MKKNDLQIEYLKERLEYDADTGIFTWRENGREASAKNGSGYIQILNIIFILITGPRSWHLKKY